MCSVQDEIFMCIEEDKAKNIIIIKKEDKIRKGVTRKFWGGGVPSI